MTHCCHLALDLDALPMDAAQILIVLSSVGTGDDITEQNGSIAQRADGRTEVLTTSNVAKYRVGQRVSAPIEGYIVRITPDIPGAVRGAGKLEVGDAPPVIGRGEMATFERCSACCMDVCCMDVCCMDV
jgi:hypothetical protein